MGAKLNNMSATKREFDEEFERQHMENMQYLAQSELPRWLWDLYPTPYTIEDMKKLEEWFKPDNKGLRN